MEWKPKDKGHGASVDWEYIDREAARFWGYTLGGWLREAPVVRARAIAHYMEQGIRESYAMEKMKDASPGAPPAPATGATDFFQYRQGGGVA